MTHAWLLLLVDPAEPLVCQVRPSQCQITHYRHAAWLLEQTAEGKRTPHFSGRSAWQGIEWTARHSVVVFDWSDDDCTLTFHGERLSEFHLVSVAAYCRQQSDTPVLQTLVHQELEKFQREYAAAKQAEQEAQAVADALAASGNGEVDPTKLILLGR